jgi:hypothetical protein
MRSAYAACSDGIAATSFAYRWPFSKSDEKCATGICDHTIPTVRVVWWM